MKAIVAVNNKGFIGLNGKLPWRSPDDLRHFKLLTTGGILLAGYNTMSTLPELKGRTVFEAKDNIIHLISLNPSFYTNLWCIGGKKTYEKLCHLFTELHISHINDNAIGDTTYPSLIGLPHSCQIFNYNFNTI